MKKTAITIAISATMAVLGAILINVVDADAKAYLQNPGLLGVIVLVSIGLWLQAARENKGNFKSLALLTIFGLMSPLAGALIAGLATGFIGGAVIAAMIVCHTWYIAFPVGLVTGLMIYFYTKPNSVPRGLDA